MFVQIENEKNLVRDSNSMLISNVNQSERQAYYNRKRLIKQQNQRLDKLENDMSDIKNMLQKLLDNNK